MFLKSGNYVINIEKIKEKETKRYIVLPYVGPKSEDFSLKLKSLVTTTFLKSILMLLLKHQQQSEAFFLLMIKLKIPKHNHLSFIN